MCIYWRNSQISILTFVLDAQKNRLMTFIPFVNKKTALRLSKLEKRSHPSISIFTPVFGAQKNRLDEAIPLSIYNQLLKQLDCSP